MSGRVRIKICGIRDRGTAEVAVEAGADALGLVFAAGSPRRVTPDQAREAVRGLPPFVEVVGLFVRSNLETIQQAHERVPLTMVQMHGQEPRTEVEAAGPMRVMRAVPFAPERVRADLAHWDQVYREAGNLAAVLLDTPDPKRAGGTGKKFDWGMLREMLDELQPAVPIVLAGGLNPENVAEAIRVVKPYAVDVSSGVEAKKGVKDPGKVRAFCQAVRGA